MSPSAHTVTGADIYTVCLCMHIVVVLNCSASSEVIEHS